MSTMVCLNSWGRAFKSGYNIGISLMSLVSIWVAVVLTGTRGERYRILGIAKCRKSFPFSLQYVQYANAFLHISCYHSALLMPLLGSSSSRSMPCWEGTYNSCGFSSSKKGSSLSLSSSTVISSPAQCCTPRSTALGGMSTLLTT